MSENDTQPNNVISVGQLASEVTLLTCDAVLNEFTLLAACSVRYLTDKFKSRSFSIS